MDSMLEISTLGGLSVKRNGEPLEPGLSRKAEALLLYLAYSKKPQPRTVLAELFWYERTEDLSLSNLRTLLTRARQYLDPYLVTSRETVGINPEKSIWLDVIELEQELAFANQHLARQGTYSREAVARLEKALTLYKGEFLQGFNMPDMGGFEEWASQEREHLHNQAIEALQNLVAYRLDRGEYTQGIELAKRLLQLDPLHEETHRHMLMLLALSGQRSAALTHYKNYQRYLSHELDVSPEAETTDLYERIRTGSFDKEIAQVISLGDRAGKTSLIPTDRISQLQRVSLFADAPDNMLAELAAVLEEVNVREGEVIFEKGDIGQCMYIIVEGQVRVHDGTRVINDLSARDIFGEMAVLDAAPRLATVTALTNVRLWRLEQDTLYRLMAGRIEVVRGIIQVLSRRLRDRVQDVVELRALLQSQGSA